MSEQKDTEIILGTGKLLAIFFGLVAICGSFFGLGYSLGRTSSPMALRSGPATVVSGPGTKPVAGVTLTTPAAVTEPPSSGPNAPVDSQPAQSSSPDAATVDRTADDAIPAPTVKPAAQTSTSEIATTSTATPELQGGSITVQVSAVTKEEDAQALVSALRKKNYPVFVSPNASSDNLYHVQVGPFAELKDAEAMKGKLAGDGYNAIVKK
jgi:cell division septation protein DedD